MPQWYCPHCTEAARTVDDAIPYHRCHSTKGLLTPLIVAGTKAKVEVREREDYVGKERVQTNAEGRPVMSVVTTRSDGQDCIIFPPTAHVITEASI
jgi:hypothetical protein